MRPFAFARPVIYVTAEGVAHVGALPWRAMDWLGPVDDWFAWNPHA